MIPSPLTTESFSLLASFIPKLAPHRQHKQAKYMGCRQSPLPPCIGTDRMMDRTRVLDGLEFWQELHFLQNRKIAIEEKANCLEFVLKIKYFLKNWLKREEVGLKIFLLRFYISADVITGWQWLSADGPSFIGPIL